MTVDEYTPNKEKASEAVLMELKKIIGLAGGDIKLIHQLLDQISEQGETLIVDKNEAGITAQDQLGVTRGLQNTTSPTGLNSSPPEAISQQGIGMEGADENDVWTNIDTNKFYPGKSSHVGFLAQGETLREVILQDRELCARLGTTPREIGEKIESIINNAVEQIDIVHQQTGEYPDGSKYFTVGKNNFRYQSWRGGQECPFEGEHYKYGNMEIEIGLGDSKTGEYFSAPGLIPHLLQKHDFFEGHTQYRVDPEKAARILELGIFAEKEESSDEGR